MTEEIFFGVWLRKQRRAMDLSRQAFADQVGCAPITLRRIESGMLKPSRELAHVFLEKLGIPESERSQWVSFARGLSGFPSPSLPLSNKRKSNLPAPLTTFIGREKEQAQVGGLLTKHRLVTLTGPGGVGKTRLSTKVGEQVLREYNDGVWLVELAPILDALLVPRTAALAVGLRDEPQRPVIDMLSDYLREKEILLILDNCEHLLDGCARFADTLLKRCPGLKILATSREALGILGEAIYPVPSLEFPDPQQLVERFRDYESVHLFEERAQLARMDFSLTIESVASVAKICSQLDGIPLAIELAAARVGPFSVKQIAVRLEESFSLLASGNRAALPRHQTLQAAIDWSYDLLSVAEQRLFRRLSVFVDGWTLEAAESICQGGSVDSEDVLNLLEQLIKKSMIVKKEVEHESRYHMLETLRQYANAKQVEAGESDGLRDRHLEYFLTLAEAAAPHLIRPEQLEWLAQLDADYENLRTALDWASNNQTAELALRLSGALATYWKIRCYSIEGSTWLKNAISKPINPSSHAELAARVKALYQDAELASSLDDLERMTNSAALALKLAKESQNPLDMAIAQVYVGLSCQRRGDRDRATILLEASLDQFRNLKAPYWEAQSYYWLSSILLGRGDITLPELVLENLRLARIAGERLLLANNLVDYAYYLSMNVDRAQKYAEEADLLFKQVGSPLNRSYFILAELAWLKGEREKARQLLLELEERLSVIGEKYVRSDAIADLGLLALEEDRYSEAQEYFEQALTTARELEDKTFISWRLSELGKLFFLRGDMDQSKQNIKKSISLVKEISPILRIHPLILILSTLYSQQPQISTRILGAVHALFQKIGHPNFDPRPLERYYDTAASFARATLGNILFESAFAEGQNMSLDEALDLISKTVEKME